jgi:hypothetical protein
MGSQVRPISHNVRCLLFVKEPRVETELGPVRAIVKEIANDPTSWQVSSIFPHHSSFHHSSSLTQLRLRRRYAVALTVQHIITAWSLN